MARHCTRVVSAVALPDFPGFASQFVGLPVRNRAVAPGAPNECRIRLGLDPFLPVLLVTGASQGATSVNDFMLETAKSHASMFAGWQVLHLAGHGGEGPLREAYARAGVQAVVLPFLHEMGLAWGAADLAISRAGANSVAEIALNAVPALFLPYPHHKDMHQRHNAQPLVDAGGAVMEIDRVDAAANLAAVGPILEGLMRDNARRGRMRETLRARPHENAAMTIARMLV
jgi:UDP-N-acetylglucosamine--N-acetylmuramyl-(pentapeptide) pyrophosphoryl-undecaprenol N-acetylglucosamine transferase